MSTAVPELVAFLNKQVAEDERAAKDLLERRDGLGFIVAMFAEGSEIPDKLAGRVLREAEAKRRVLARHKPVGPSRYRTARDELNCEGCGWEGEHGDPVTENIDECPELRDLASAYAAHGDYRAEWAA